MSYTYTYDDGSTYTIATETGAVSSTPRTNGTVMDMVSSGREVVGSWEQSQTGAGGSWSDVLRGLVMYGVPRAIDSNLRMREQTAIAPTQFVQPQQQPAGIAGVSPAVLMIGAAIVFAVIALR